MPTCQQTCVNCGVCKNLGVKKVYDEPFDSGIQASQILKPQDFDPSVCPKDIKETFKYRIKITKTGLLKYFSFETYVKKFSAEYEELVNDNE